MEVKLNLSTTEHKDLLSYCNLNDLLISSVVKDSFTVGFNIERYGLLNTGQEVIEKEVIKEIIKYVEIPVVEEKEVIRIEYVDVEKPIEVIKEVIVEKVVEVIKEVSVPNLDNIWDETKVNELLLKIQQLENQEPIIKEVIVEKEVIKEVVVEKETTDNSLKPKLDALQNTVQKLKQDNIDKDKKIKEYEKTIEDIQKFNDDKRAMFLKGSNLDDKLYK
jgi:hypothetical protein